MKSRGLTAICICSATKSTDTDGEETVQSLSVLPVTDQKLMFRNLTQMSEFEPSAQLA